MHSLVALDPEALKLTYELRLAGCACQIHTNSHTLGQTLRRWIGPSLQPQQPDLQLHIVVGPSPLTEGAAAHFRGMKHVVVASFGASVFLFDLLRCRVAAFISEACAADQCFWDRTLLPIVLGVLGPAVGTVPIHAASLSFENTGILIAGSSGAGKSTLSVALAHEEMDFISDDWSYLALRGERLFAHGMSLPAKLLPDAVAHFPLLQRYSTRMTLNQELAYELPAEDLGTRLHLVCEPRWFFFLERDSQPGCRIAPVSSEEAHLYVHRSVERLPAELGHLTQSRSAVLEHVQRLSCCKLTYGGPPQIAAQSLRTFLVEQRTEVSR